VRKVTGTFRPLEDASFHVRRQIRCSVEVAQAVAEEARPVTASLLATECATRLACDNHRLDLQVQEGATPKAFALFEFVFVDCCYAAVTRHLL